MRTVTTTQSQKHTIDFLCYLFLIFIIGCSVGWIFEEVYCGITDGVLQNRGILYGPWLPIYGIGALCMYILKPVKCFAAMGLVFHYLLEPVVERMVRRTNPNTIHIDCLVLLLLFLSDCIMSALFRTPITY